MKLLANSTREKERNTHTHMCMMGSSNRAQLVMEDGLEGFGLIERI